jgi:hypothetical protein
MIQLDKKGYTMLTSPIFSPGKPALPTESQAKALYLELLKEDKHPLVLDRAREFLKQILEAAKHQVIELPDIDADLKEWMVQQAQKTGLQYQAYLQKRHQGGPRQYFSCKAHALYFLNCVAPTKLVDGSWLQGFTRQWQEPKMIALIQIYLEELGGGDAEKNHVMMFRKLLRQYGCDTWPMLSDKFFIQGAIQLALAEHTETFLPEVLGYNFGYELLPLHLLITAYELQELDIDAHYFNVHITTDNAITGHSHLAAEAITAYTPSFGDKLHYWRRVINGIKLNAVGMGTLDIIRSFDIENELIGILKSKAPVGKYMHSDAMILKGRTINQWLSHPADMPAFLKALESEKWVKRHRHPDLSPFWNMLNGGRSRMQGVFSPYEKQVIRDWIAGDAQEAVLETDRASMHKKSIPARRIKGLVDASPSLMLLASRLQDTQAFEAYIASLGSAESRLNTLSEWLSASRQDSPFGLVAARLYKSELHFPAD